MIPQKIFLGLVQLLFLVSFSLPAVHGEEQCINLPPVAEFTYSPQSPKVLDIITFNASESHDPDGFIFSYTWDFGDSNITTLSVSTITHYYLGPGNYDVNLTVMDNLGLTNSTLKAIVVKARVVAAFSYSPLNPQVGKPVTFNASESTPGFGTITSYEWNFGDGNTVKVSDPVVTHYYTSERTYLVVLNVTNSQTEWDVASQTINVTKPLTVPPHAVFTWSPINPQAGEPVIFDASASTPNGGEIVSYRWDFGDGTIKVAAHPTIEHVYSNFGDYMVVLNVTDSEGESGSALKVVTVVAPPHADFFFEPTEPRVLDTVTFNASLSTPNGGYIVSYEWNFGDGTPQKFGKIVTYRFLNMGQYIVSLNVTDSEGKWDAKAITLKVLPHLADVNEDGKINIIDMTIFARAFGSYPGKERWNPRVDLDNNQKIDILDGVIIAKSFNFDP